MGTSSLISKSDGNWQCNVQYNLKKCVLLLYNPGSPAWWVSHRQNLGSSPPNCFLRWISRFTHLAARTSILNRISRFSTTIERFLQSKLGLSFSDLIIIRTKSAWWVYICSKNMDFSIESAGSWSALHVLDELILAAKRGGLKWPGLNHHQHELNSCWMCLLPQKLGFACEEGSAGSSPPCYKLDVDVMCRAAKS